MRVIVIGTGTIGTAVKKALEKEAHEVVPVSRNSGEFRADISDSESLKALFRKVGHFDAVACGQKFLNNELRNVLGIDEGSIIFDKGKIVPHGAVNAGHQNQGRRRPKRLHGSEPSRTLKSYPAFSKRVTKFSRHS
jgi:hypothetical protein